MSNVGFDKNSPKWINDVETAREGNEKWWARAVNDMTFSNFRLSGYAVDHPEVPKDLRDGYAAYLKARAQK